MALRKSAFAQDVEQAHFVLESLPTLGISLAQVTQQLEDQGVETFNKPFDQLMETLEKDRLEVQRRPVHV